jgi:hypothetical protein
MTRNHVFMSKHYLSICCYDQTCMYAGLTYVVIHKQRKPCIFKRQFQGLLLKYNYLHDLHLSSQEVIHVSLHPSEDQVHALLHYNYKYLPQALLRRTENLVRAWFS